MYNGFLFCDGHDGIFDKGLISFTDEGNVMVSSKLSKQDLYIIKPETIKLNILDAQKKYLEWHRENRFKRWIIIIRLGEILVFFVISIKHIKPNFNLKLPYNKVTWF